MPNFTVVVEQVFDYKLEKIWRAFTEPACMKLWYFDIPEFKAEIGCKFRFHGGDDPAHLYVHLCEVVEVVPFHMLAHTWCYEGYEGESKVVLRFTEMHDQTLVRLEHHGLLSFPSDVPDLAMGNFVEGWNHIIKTSLQEYLEKYD